MASSGRHGTLLGRHRGARFEEIQNQKGWGRVERRGAGPGCRSRACVCASSWQEVRGAAGAAGARGEGQLRTVLRLMQELLESLS